MSILVITTGGTIGALPHEAPKSYPHFVPMPPDGKDFVREILLDVHFSSSNTRCVSLEVRDSKLIDQAYLLNMLKLIEEVPERKILITHGTDTLLQSADFFYRQLKDNPALKGKVILLTGSMIPLSNGPESDGYVNLEFSLQKLEQLRASSAEENIYIVLCDYEFPETDSGAWKPYLYQYSSGAYEKVYTADGRYNRLRRVKQNA